jgi:hypothetical protein
VQTTDDNNQPRRYIFGQFLVAMMVGAALVASITTANVVLMVLSLARHFSCG